MIPNSKFMNHLFQCPYCQTIFPNQTLADKHEIGHCMAVPLVAESHKPLNPDGSIMTEVEQYGQFSN